MPLWAKTTTSLLLLVILASVLLLCGFQQAVFRAQNGLGGSTVAFDAIAHNGTTSATTSIPSFNLTIGAITNGAVMVGVATDQGSVTGTTVTVGGVSATALSGANNASGFNARAQVFCLATGSTTGAQAIVVSWTGSAFGGATAMSASGVDQSTPCNNGTGTFANTNGSSSFSITSVLGDLSFDIDSNSGGTTPTAPQQTSKFAGNSGPNQIGYATSIGPGTGTATFGWTNSSDYANSGGNFKAHP